MAPIIFRTQQAKAQFFTHQMFFNRDFWLHALTLPSAIVQRLYMSEISSTSRAPYYLPAERFPHLRTLMAWPDDTFNDNSDDLWLAQQEVACIANAVAKYEPVWMYASQRNIAEAHVSENVSIVDVEVDQPWIRDIGPVLVTALEDSNRLVGIDFNFDYWGGKFIISASNDRTFARRSLEHAKVKRLAASMATEGGALEVDGEGTLLATESSLLRSNRNRGKDKAGMEDTFRELLGITKAIWLQGAMGLDVTDGHIDHLARFGPNSNTVILSRPHISVPWTDPRFVAYAQARFVLSTSSNAAGAPFNIVEIEEAATVDRAEDDGMAPGEAATSYVNYYLANDAVIVPQFGEHRTDEKAVQTMKELFPDRVIETVTLNWLPWAGRGPHSVTQQWPFVKEGRSC
jgi:agmatine deiminase